MPTYGLEEEVFVCEPERPSLKSLYYLARLLWRDPRANYTGTASNFARGDDLRQGLMSGVEISTGTHTTAHSLMEDLVRRRAELAAVCEGLIVPLGHLIDYRTPTNVCALQLHIGDVSDQRRTYANLAHFLPILTLLTINAPYAGGEYFGQSYRMATAYAIGPLKGDWAERFQDIILAKRLKTIELRVFDPTWDLERIRALVKAVDAIVGFPGEFPLDRARYNGWRPRLVKEGYFADLDHVRQELKQIVDVPDDLVKRTASDEVKALYERHGLVRMYSALDSAYRGGRLEPQQVGGTRGRLAKSAAGFVGYYLPKLPYVVYKYLRES